MTQDQVATVLTAAVPVLVAIGGVIRYLVRILASVDRATTLAEQAAQMLADHVQQSDSIHSKLTTELADHRTSLALLGAAKEHPA